MWRSDPPKYPEIAYVAEQIEKESQLWPASGGHQHPAVVPDPPRSGTTTSHSGALVRTVSGQVRCLIMINDRGHGGGPAVATA